MILLMQQKYYNNLKCEVSTLKIYNNCCKIYKK